MEFHIAVLLKIIASTGIGLLIGMEREWSHKEIGIRSFALTALLGTIAWLVTPVLALVQVSAMLVIIVMANLYTAWKTQSLQITTSLALLLTNIFGMVVGSGNFFLAGTCALLVTALLSWKTELISLSTRITVDEIRSLLFIGFMTAVIFPLLPNYPVDPWHLLNVRFVWLAVIIFAGLSFCNYVILRHYGERGMRYGIFLGGLINSAATIVFLSQEQTKVGKALNTTPSLVLLAEVAMLLRNTILLIIFALPLNLRGLLPAVTVLLAMILTASLIVFVLFKRAVLHGEFEQMRMELKSPLAIRSILSFSCVFLVLSIASELTKRLLGTIGFLTILTVGAIVSTASASILLGQQLAMGNIDVMATTLATFSITLVGLLVNVVVCYVITHNVRVSLRLFVLNLTVILVGGLVTGLFSTLWRS